MITIKNLEGVHFDTLYQAFALAFVDYDAPTISKSALEAMLERRGFSPKHSFGAFDEENLVGFTFNGIGTHLGKSTAYDTGTGTIKEYRGQKLASRIFGTSIPLLKQEGIEQYLLEVLQHNTVAFNIYKKQGFTISREFNYYFIDSARLKPTSKDLSTCYTLVDAQLSELPELSELWDFAPSWQNSLDSIKRRATDFKITTCLHNDIPVAYCIFDPNSGDVAQLAVAKPHRRQGIATILMNKMLEVNNYNSIKILNTEKGSEAMEAFINSLSIPLSGLQYEMIRTL